MFTIDVKRRALRRLEELDEKQKKRLKEIIILLKDDPVPFRKADVSKLKGFKDEYRIRVGELRLVYAVLWAERRILIHYIGPREKAYRL